jgi:hypothetical protein
MTIAELIEELKKLPPEMPVISFDGPDDDIMEGRGVQTHWLKKGPAGGLFLGEQGDPRSFCAAEVI